MITMQIELYGIFELGCISAPEEDTWRADIFNSSMELDQINIALNKRRLRSQLYWLKIAIVDTCFSCSWDNVKCAAALFVMGIMISGVAIFDHKEIRYGERRRLA